MEVAKVVIQAGSIESPALEVFLASATLVVRVLSQEDVGPLGRVTQGGFVVA